MKFISTRGFVVAIAAIGLFLTAQPAKAAFITNGMSTEGLGTFAGSLTVATVDANTATLTFSLTNTSPAANGGYLTAFAFNNPGTFAIDLDSSTKSSFATEIPGPVSASPFGDFDFGVGITNTWLGAGGDDNTDGLGVGESATWVLTITGAGAGSLDENSFLTAYNSGANSAHDEQFFVARFRAFVDGGSDKVGGNVTTNVVPAPAGLILLASAVPVFALRRLVRRKPAAA